MDNNTMQTLIVREEYLLDGKPCLNVFGVDTYRAIDKGKYIVLNGICLHGKVTVMTNTGVVVEQFLPENHDKTRLTMYSLDDDTVGYYFKYGTKAGRGYLNKIQLIKETGEGDYRCDLLLLYIPQLSIGYPWQVPPSLLQRQFENGILDWGENQITDIPSSDCLYLRSDRHIGTVVDGGTMCDILGSNVSFLKFRMITGIPVIPDRIMNNTVLIDDDINNLTIDDNMVICHVNTGLQICAIENNFTFVLLDGTHATINNVNDFLKLKRDLKDSEVNLVAYIGDVKLLNTYKPLMREPDNRDFCTKY